MLMCIPVRLRALSICELYCRRCGYSLFPFSRRSDYPVVPADIRITKRSHRSEDLYYLSFTETTKHFISNWIHGAQSFKSTHWSDCHEFPRILRIPKHSLSVSTAHYIHISSIYPISKPGIPALVYIGKKSSINTCFDTTILDYFDISLVSQFWYIFNHTLQLRNDNNMCQNVTTYFDNPYSTLHNIRNSLTMAAVFSRNMYKN